VHSLAWGTGVKVSVATIAYASTDLTCSWPVRRLSCNAWFSFHIQRFCINDIYAITGRVCRPASIQEKALCTGQFIVDKRSDQPSFGIEYQTVMSFPENRTGMQSQVIIRPSRQVKTLRVAGQKPSTSVISRYCEFRTGVAIRRPRRSASWKHHHRAFLDILSSETPSVEFSIRKCISSEYFMPSITV